MQSKYKLGNKKISTGKEAASTEMHTLDAPGQVKHDER